MQYIQACLLTKQNFLLYFDAGLGHRGSRSYIDWLRLSCDISPCDLSSERNPETYGRPVKSAITEVHLCCSQIPEDRFSSVKTHKK